MHLADRWYAYEHPLRGVMLAYCSELEKAGADIGIILGMYSAMPEVKVRCRSRTYVICFTATDLTVYAEMHWGSHGHLLRVGYDDPDSIWKLIDIVGRG